jgi:hypothetical protein
VKIGYYTSKTASHKIPRYRCKACGKSFSTRTAKPTVHQKKPHLNRDLFMLLVSGVSLRRASQILNVRYDTVLYHFDYLAKQAQKAHTEHLKSLQTSYVMVDELETYIHTKAKCVSVPMVVRIKTGEILGFAVAKMKSKGKLAAIGKSKYNWTTNERSRKFQSMLKKIRPNLKSNITIKSDSFPSYPSWISKVLPHATLEQVLSGKNQPKGSFDELFSINNTFARMRHDMNRLGRKTWSTTKEISGLEKHLWLYVAWNNKYYLT